MKDAIDADLNRVLGLTGLLKRQCAVLRKESSRMEADPMTATSADMIRELIRRGDLVVTAGKTNSSGVKSDYGLRSKTGARRYKLRSTKP